MLSIIYLYLLSVNYYVDIFTYFGYYFSMKIGNNLRKLRKKKGLSLRELEKEIGISYNTLGSYERNTCQPTIENCYTICKYFEVPMEYLIFGDDISQDFKDYELVQLLHEIDEMKSEDREVIKKLIKRYISAKKELNQITEGL